MKKTNKICLRKQHRGPRYVVEKKRVKRDILL